MNVSIRPTSRSGSVSGRTSNVKVRKDLGQGQGKGQNHSEYQVTVTVAGKLQGLCQLEDKGEGWNQCQEEY